MIAVVLPIIVHVKRAAIGRVGSFEDNGIGYQILLDIEGFMPIVDELDEDNLEKSIKNK